MTLQEIISEVVGELGTRQQVQPEQVLARINFIQEIAFNEKIDAFLEYDEYVAVNPLSPLGPYDYPIDPPCRLFVGVTTLDEDTLSVGVPVDRDSFTPIINKVLDRQFRFPTSTPPDDTPEKYRYVYYRGAPHIATDQDNDNLIIPPAYHYTMIVQGAVKLADFAIWGDETAENYNAQIETIRPLIQPWYDELNASLDLGNIYTTVSGGQPGL